MCSVYVIKRTSQESLAIQMNGERTTERERKREKDRYTNNNNKNRESSKTHYHTRIFRFGGGCGGWYFMTMRIKLCCCSRGVV